MYRTYSVEPIIYNTYNCVYLKPKKTISSPFYYPLAVTGEYLLSSKTEGCCSSTRKYALYPESYFYPNYYYYYYYYPSYTTDNSYLNNYTYKDDDNTEKKKNDSEKKKEYEYVDRDKYVCNHFSVESSYVPKRAVYIPPTIIVP
ncbi:conserved Plasmodium protein, unknown function [Plasmodium gallinaceum]|uniref:Sporozoite surface protein essential for liver stage development n=1 Tax=Plasmodium gallinaceum TaxID=5849 RepID=A0A1J1GVZ2_PLAGA|nr:conserved Plasmodium protein, unknown function [Plasmodium gallinaceum]CRG96430.1 conserved Plasmodium protein, unknown function [Plasmodium gallinaceum]